MIKLLMILLRNLVNKKRYFVTLSTVITILLAIFLMICYYDASINMEYINNINNRTLIANIQNKNDINDIKKMAHINAVFLKIPYISIEIDNKKFKLDYLNDNNINILSGNNISKLKNNEIIVPSTCFNSEYLGKEMIVKVNNKEYRYIISGIFESSSCKNIYMSLYSIMDIMKNNNIEYNENEFIIIIDDYSFAVQVIQNLKDKNIETSFLDSTGILNMEVYYKIINLLKIMVYIFIIVTGIIFYFILKKIFDEESKDVGYMRIIGYKIKDVLKILIFRNVCYIIFVFLSCFIFLNLIILMVYFTEEGNAFIRVLIYNYNIFILLNLALLILFSIYSILICYTVKGKLKKLKLIEVIKDNYI